jgi:FMN phosphatase YigB (HAD superfamily)
MKPPIQAIAFDAYGTLFDVHSVIALCNQKFSGQWRKRAQGQVPLRRRMVSSTSPFNHDIEIHKPSKLEPRRP